ncbi:Asg7p Ecym_8109 [Eremothecium cymbalariae DBVPG|uniref:Uncharacterized protein n=1 Tax=Eremothecium cymbalariae (strain CBS 270.75 / DBVPG 7215 / KCTC 17166 / NRRL Y-17582) TaxID=931890 RepID=G8JX29_ERECY|nr:Hypothetical protein Ecym_8109 [Eremothecium cymbalariae DBVPG\
MCELGIIPFQEELGIYFCQCTSCSASKRYRSYIVRFFVAGFFIPLFWFIIIGLCIYIHLWHYNDVMFPTVADNELPTQFEMERDMERQIVTITKGKNNTYHVVSQKCDTKTAEDICDVVTTVENDASFDLLKLLHYHHYKMMAEHVIESHDYWKKCYLKWSLRAGACIIGNTALVMTFFATTSSYNINKSQMNIAG